eukprot:7970300-Pyramimonas_sp.AAC.1
MGKARRNPVQKARVAKLKRRAHRFRGLRSPFKSLTRIVRAGANPAGLYGASVTGVSDRSLQQLRSVAGEAVFGQAKGR